MGGQHSTCGCFHSHRGEPETILYEDKQHMTKVLNDLEANT